MALSLTSDNVYKLYNIDRSKKIEGIAVLQQKHVKGQAYAEHPRLFDGLILAFMVNGSMKARIHFLEYELCAGQIAIVQPQLMIETLSMTENAEIITIGLSLDFITAFPMLHEFVMNNQIRWQPVLSLQAEEMTIKNELLSLIQKVYHKNQSPKKIEMLRHLVISLMSLISESYTALADHDNPVKSRTHEIIDDFYLLISKYATQERSVYFYAEKLHLTPQYLSTFLKQKTGKSILQWIDYVTLMHAKTLLKSTSLSIKQISNQLNFDEPSVFCRFFKRLSGTSPGVFRNRP
ncbi:helix-turn-helix domain-containing protein [Sphingobacterium ginsenosidimutans]|uniref:Helix-turn-helix transcriptional regulator n=2 Tax=Sphingobacterium TaxID=28453 RepID=A0ABP7ZWR7_9SPHI